MNEIHEIYESLHAASHGALNGRFIGNSKDHIAALDQAGNYHLLLKREATPNSGSRRIHGGISVHGSQEFTVHLDDSSVTATYSSISLLRERKHLLAVFCSVAKQLLEPMAQNLSDESIDQLLDDFVDLFRPDSLPSEETVKGLWGELWLMATAPSQIDLVSKWHRTSHELYDFSSSRWQIEVKTHEGPRPIHHFSHRQLSLHPDSTQVVSLCIRRSISGKSMGELLSQVRKSTDGQSARKISILVLSLLGAYSEEIEDLRFEIEPDPGPSALVAGRVPQLVNPKLGAISNIRYDVDLSEAIISHGSELSDLWETLIRIDSTDQQGE